MAAPTFEQWYQELYARADAEGLRVLLDYLELLDEYDTGTTVRQLLDSREATCEVLD